MFISASSIVISLTQPLSLICYKSNTKKQFFLEKLKRKSRIVGNIHNRKAREIYTYTCDGLSHTEQDLAHSIYEHSKASTIYDPSDYNIETLVNSNRWCY